MYIRRRKKVHSYACKTENQAIKDKEKHHFSFEGYDLTQKVYLIPLYFSALSNVWLNEDAIFFAINII